MKIIIQIFGVLLLNWIPRSGLQLHEQTNLTHDLWTYRLYLYLVLTSNQFHRGTGFKIEGNFG